MKCQSYIVKKDDLTDFQFEILMNICGAFGGENSFVVKVDEIAECLEITKSMNDGSEVMDCQGRTWTPNYDSDIEFMEDLLEKSDGCDYVIVVEFME